MLNMDPTRLPSYLRGASEQELATLAQQARNPQIIVAVQDEMERRKGGLMSDEMGPPPPPAAAPMPQKPPQLAEVATEGWVPPWQRNDGKGPFPSLVQAGPVPDDSVPDDPWLRGAREQVTPGGLQMGLQQAGPVPEWQDDVVRPPELETRTIDDMPVYDADAQGEDIEIAPEAIELGRALETASEDPDAVQALIAEMQGSLRSPDQMRNDSIARAGFAMAASSNPYFFGALGEGGLAGMDAYEKSRQEALMNRVRMAGLQQDQQKFGEQKRATGVSETQAETRLGQAERQVALAEKEYDRKVQEYEDGRITRDALAAAEVKLREAQARYYSERPRSTSKADLLQDADGNLMRLTPEGGAEYVTDPEGNRVKASKLGASGQTAMMKNAAYLGDLLFGGDEAAGARLLQQGKTMSPDQIRVRAMALASDVAAGDPTLVDATERQMFIQDKAAEIEAALIAAKDTATAAPAVDAAAAPVAAPVAEPATTTPAAPAYPVGTIVKNAAGERMIKTETGWAPYQGQ